MSNRCADQGGLEDIILLGSGLNDGVVARSEICPNSI